MKVGVVGCGTAGAAAALFLKRLGHDVEVFERVPEPMPVGAGVLLQPTGMTVLSKLGLLDDVWQRAARIERLWGRTPWGRCVLNVRYGDYNRFTKHSFEPVHGLGIHRGVLFQTLFDAVKAAHISVHCGVEITDCENSGNQVKLIDSAGEPHGEFDLIVAADGTRSAMRQTDLCSALVRRSKDYLWGALWAIVPGVLSDYSQTLFQVYAGTKRLLGFLPTGSAIRADEPLTSIFWSIRLDRVDAWRKRKIDDWKAEMCSLAPNAEPLLDFIQDHDQMAVAGYLDMEMKKWNTDRIVFLGDAGHSMSPQLGQGANFALMDAMVLSEVLQSPEFQSQRSIPSALDEYTKRRKAQLRYYQFASRFLTPLFQCSFTPLSWPRDWIFEPVSRIPFFKRQMVESLVGAKTGHFTALAESRVVGYQTKAPQP